ncbi:MAG: hypothetical protein JXA52_05350 [Planctomycetes bacterium]|nr:hypothetical protein [Planctomycetota bacterium]
MKESPQRRELEEVLRSSKLVAYGFMGMDTRHLSEIIDNDLAEVSRAGYTLEQLAGRMQEITDQAATRFGGWVEINENLRARVVEAKGRLVCPWPHPGRFNKRVTMVEHLKTGETISWSDLNIHMISEHGFFEGKGSAFRLEPEELFQMIF